MFLRLYPIVDADDKREEHTERPLDEKESYKEVTLVKKLCLLTFNGKMKMPSVSPEKFTFLITRTSRRIQVVFSMNTS